MVSPMPADLFLRCSCGGIRGAVTGVSGARGNRVVCYCDDCQAFARFLGRADDILDAHGGTDVFQTSSGRIRITEGRERLACVRLSRVGPLRWYSACCHTPIANTLAIRLAPFAGLFRVCIGDAEGISAEEALGPVRRRVFGRFARGDTDSLVAHGSVPLGMMLRVATMLFVARMRGDHKRSPFFDERGALVATPRVLDEEEVKRLQEPSRG